MIKPITLYETNGTMVAKMNEIIATLNQMEDKFDFTPLHRRDRLKLNPDALDTIINKVKES